VAGTVANDPGELRERGTARRDGGAGAGWLGGGGSASTSRRASAAVSVLGPQVRGRDLFKNRISSELHAIAGDRSLYCAPAARIARCAPGRPRARYAAERRLNEL
jgi:hypothetical protein